MRFSPEVRLQSQLVVSLLGRGKWSEAEETVNKMTPKVESDFRIILQQANDLTGPRYVEGVSDEMGG